MGGGGGANGSCLGYNAKWVELKFKNYSHGYGEMISGHHNEEHIDETSNRPAIKNWKVFLSMTSMINIHMIRNESYSQ